MTEHGINVIYNLRWSDTSSLCFCLSGVPSGSVISIRLGSDSDSSFFYEGLEFIFSNIKPVYIIFFGNPFFSVPIDIPYFVYPSCHYS
jgi:hypothetical protein